MEEEEKKPTRKTLRKDFDEKKREFPHFINGTSTQIITNEKGRDLIRAPALYQSESCNPQTFKLNEDAAIQKNTEEEKKTRPTTRKKKYNLPTAKREKYALECFCKYTEKAWGNFEDAKDFRSQNLEVVNVRNGLPMRTFGDLCKNEPFSAQAAAMLAERYSHWRRIRADGNCYYRAVYVGYVEMLILCKPHSLLLEFIYK